MTNTRTWVFTGYSPQYSGELARRFVEEARHVVGERSPDFNMEGCGARAPQDDVCLAQNGASAHSDWKGGDVQVQRASGVEQRLCGGPGHFQRQLAGTDLN